MQPFPVTQAKRWKQGEPDSEPAPEKPAELTGAVNDGDVDMAGASAAATVPGAASQPVGQPQAAAAAAKADDPRGERKDDNVQKRYDFFYI